MRIGGLPYSAKYSYRFTETSKEMYINNDDGSRTFDSSEPVEYDKTSDGEIIVLLTDTDGYHYYHFREFEEGCVLDAVGEKQDIPVRAVYIESKICE